MAGVTPTFKIQWTKQERTTSAVSGDTYEDVFKFFQKKNAAKEEWAKFHHEKPDIAFKTSKSGPITDVVLKVGFVLTMPSWSKSGSLGTKAKAAWDKMMTALAKHEENHRLILVEQSLLFGEKVTAESDLTLAKLKELFKKFPGDVKAAQDKYDGSSKNGVNEGVFLPAPDQVED